MLIAVAKGLLGFLCATYLLSLTVVIGGNLLGVLARRVRPMDGTQKRVMAEGQPSPLLRPIGLLLEAAAQWLTVAADIRRLIGPYPRPPRLQATDATPVLVLPGYMETVGCMRFLARWLEDRGFAVEQAEFPSTLWPIAKNAAFLRKRVAEIRERTGADEVAVVGHSMGGIVTRCMMLEHPDDHHVKTLVCFGSPLRGVTWAVGLPGLSTSDMTHTSAHQMAFPSTARCGVPVHAIIGIQDQIVNPVWAAFTEEGENVVLDLPIGHMGMLFTRQGRETAERLLVADGVRKQAQS